MRFELFWGIILLNFPAVFRSNQNYIHVEVKEKIKFGEFHTIHYHCHHYCYCY